MKVPVDGQLVSVAIEPTNYCNLKCKICYSHNSTRPKGYMSWKMFETIMDEVDTIETVYNIGLSVAGEPLLHPRYKDMIKRVTEIPGKYPNTSIFTNGMLWTHDISKLCVERDLTRVNFSMDGIGEKHEEIRVGSKYSVIKAAIEELIETRGNNAHPRISLSCVVSNHTKNDVMSWINEWKEQPVSMIIDPLQTPEFKYVNIDELGPMFGLETKPDISPICVSPFSNVEILWNGDIEPCCADLEGKQIMGNVRDGIRNIFYGDTFKKMRNGELTGNRSTICKECESGRKSYRIYIKRVFG